ncbi:hypothetical protein EUX98_g7973 [Antrodiella citrinella]|uniref:Cytochrome b5 heme-binding domain-containing protein n=1 Tax=Antrodiella citrinella TaxID=2447956 RepID=A0A4S4MJ47_9APHY|nr:hypothetical protein EUX98_g7973 [Antrodiella citrinella]
MSESLSFPVVVSLLALLPAVLYLYTRIFRTSSPSPTTQVTEDKGTEEEEKPKTIMQPARTDLAPPKDDPFTQAELSAFDGADASKPIYVAIKGPSGPLPPRACACTHTQPLGTIFDVSHKKDTYGKGGSYNLFAGKDASKALGKSSLKEEDASPDYTSLDASERKVLDDWYAFFAKRYNVVGRVIDLPPAVANL